MHDSDHNFTSLLSPEWIEALTQATAARQFGWTNTRCDLHHGRTDASICKQASLPLSWAIGSGGICRGKIRSSTHRWFTKTSPPSVTTRRPRNHETLSNGLNQPENMNSIL